jgi:hypothetical protein
MITPAGKRKDQKNQGGLKYASIWDSDLFAKVNKFAIRTGDDLSHEQMDGANEELTDGQNIDPNTDLEPETEQLDEQMAPLQQAMMESNNSSMNNANNLSNGTNHKDFGIIANELSEFIQHSKALSQSYVLVNQQRDQKSGKWRFEIEPARQPELSVGPAVRKDGPPLTGPPQQQPMPRAASIRKSK